MTDIRYVCISDLHLGEEDSILTALNKNGVDPDTPSSVMIELVKCLKELVSKNEGDEKPTLILNGDILELALSTTHISAMVFERFMELFMRKEEELFEKIIFVPGNHDHHLWENARETQYLEVHPNRELLEPWHNTEMFLEELNNPLHCYFLECVLNKYSRKFVEDDATFAQNLKILVAYPNLGLRSTNSGRCIVIHHGHFVESVYRLMSTLDAAISGSDEEIPEDIQKLEAENFAWIDFLWSTLGESGEVEKKAEALYEHMLNSEHMEEYISKMAENLAKKYNLPKIPGDWPEKKIIQFFLKWAFDEFSKRERRVINRKEDFDKPVVFSAYLYTFYMMIFKYLGFSKSSKIGGEIKKCMSEEIKKCMSEKIKKGISLYLKTTCKQIKDECDGWKPSELIFVFGHTHKPCEEHVEIDWLGRTVPVYNTGGWVVDRVHPNTAYGGSVVLIDDELNLASLRMYKENDNPSTYCVEVKAVDENGKENPFYDRICWLVDCEKEPWKEFSSKAYSEVYDREKRLDERLRKL